MSENGEPKKKGKSGSKFTKDESQQRRMRAMKRRLRGDLLADIAKDEGVTMQQISYDIKAVRKEWLEDQKESYDELVQQKISQIDETISEAWKGWDRSQNDTITERTNKDGKETIRRTNAGNPAFLEKVLKGLSEQSDLLGLKKQPAANPNDDFTVDDYRNRIGQMLDSLAAIQPGRDKGDSRQSGGNGRVAKPD